MCDLPQGCRLPRRHAARSNGIWIRGDHLVGCREPATEDLLEPAEDRSSRAHGQLLPEDLKDQGTGITGGPNEVWAFGEDAYARIPAVLAMRERIRPYLDAQMASAHELGIPPMRPLFVDFPDDARSWSVEDEFLLGPDILVAPVLDAGARGRDVYLPPGSWSDAWSGTIYEGARQISVEAPLERIPVFLRAGADIPVAG